MWAYFGENHNLKPPVDHSLWSSRQADCQHWDSCAYRVSICHLFHDDCTVLLIITVEELCPKRATLFIRSNLYFYSQVPKYDTPKYDTFLVRALPWVIKMVKPYSYKSQSWIFSESFLIVLKSCLKPMRSCLMVIWVI